MKKTIIIFLAVLLPSFASAQLRVDSLGRVNIGYPNISSPAFYVNCNPQRINSNTGVELELSTSWQSCDKYGIKSSIYDSGANTWVRQHGLWTYAEGNSSSLTFGVTAGIQASRGAAIYTSCRWPYAPYLTGLYAGYFDGDIYVNGTVNGTLISSSDRELKENIREMSDTERSALENLNLLTPVSYNYKERTDRIPELTEEARADMIAHGVNPDDYTKGYDNPVMKKTHFGLIAQELKEIYPELVYEQQDGYLGINYTELIPVLMQAIKELNNKVEELSSNDQVAARSMQMETDDVEDAVSAESLVPSMSQNIPNPFSERTDIAITLPESVRKAILYIYDMTGKQLEQHEVAGRGETTMTIYADQMSNGMYIYALVADGKVITSRKMIVAK